MRLAFNSVRIVGSLRAYMDRGRELMRSRWGERGASMIEYVLLLALIAVIALAAVSALGDNASTEFQCVADSVELEADEC